MPPVPEAAVRPALAPLSPRWVSRRPGDGERERASGADGPPADAIPALARELNLPIRYVGIGEKGDDLLPFDPEKFIESLFA